jgi:hypothetical protein
LVDLQDHKDLLEQMVLQFLVALEFRQQSAPSVIFTSI